MLCQHCGRGHFTNFGIFSPLDRFGLKYFDPLRTKSLPISHIRHDLKGHGISPSDINMPFTNKTKADIIDL